MLVDERQIERQLRVEVLIDRDLARAGRASRSAASPGAGAVTPTCAKAGAATRRSTVMATADAAANQPRSNHGVSVRRGPCGLAAGSPCAGAAGFWRAAGCRAASGAARPLSPAPSVHDPAAGRFAARSASRAERRRRCLALAHGQPALARISFLASSIGMCATPAALIDPAVAVQPLLLVVALLARAPSARWPAAAVRPRVSSEGRSPAGWLFGIVRRPAAASGDTTGSLAAGLVLSERFEQAPHQQLRHDDHDEHDDRASRSPPWTLMSACSCSRRPRCAAGRLARAAGAARRRRYFAGGRRRRVSGRRRRRRRWRRVPAMARRRLAADLVAAVAARPWAAAALVAGVLADQWASWRTPP